VDGIRRAQCVQQSRRFIGREHLEEGVAHEQAPAALASL
jgi:hypothetical protein